MTDFTDRPNGDCLWCGGPLSLQTDGSERSFWCTSEECSQQSVEYSREELEDLEILVDRAVEKERKSMQYIANGLNIHLDAEIANLRRQLNEAHAVLGNAGISDEGSVAERIQILMDRLRGKR